MREDTYTRCILCEGETFQEAVNKFNQAMYENRMYKPTFERAGEAFLVYIKMTQFAPETIAEAKSLEGCKHTCKDCEHCVRDLNRFGVADKRKKTATCHVGNVITRIRLDSSVCDRFYLEKQDERKAVSSGR